MNIVGLGNFMLKEVFENTTGFGEWAFLYWKVRILAPQPCIL
jgi:hypothetical protein